MPMRMKLAAAIACGAALPVAAGASADAASRPAAPKLHRPRAAHVVDAPGGKRLLVAIPVMARNVGSRRTTVRLRATAILPNGDRLHAQPSSRDHHRSLPLVEHHLRFSARDTRRLRRAARSAERKLTAVKADDRSSGAAGSIELQLTAVQAEDRDGDMATDTVSPPATLDTTLPETTPAAPTPDALGAHARGTDACAYYYPQAEDGCVNVAGDTWSALSFWAGKTWSLQCPAGTDHWASGKTVVDTSSNSYTEMTAAFPGPTSDYQSVSITDDNLTGHPITYRPIIACIQMDPWPDG